MSVHGQIKKIKSAQVITTAGCS